MKKILIPFLLLFSTVAYATLSVNNVPQTKTGGSSPSVKNSSIWQVNGNVGINNSHPGQSLDVTGTVRSSLGILTSGNVGIGSSTPGQALDVVGTVRATAFSGSASGLTAIPASQISGVIPIANLATGTPNGSKFIRDDGTLATPAGGGSGGPGLWETNSIGIDTFNPVGIGSISPTQKLDVQGTIRSLSQFVNGNVGINTLSSTPIVQITGGGIAAESVNKGYELILPSPNFGGGTTEVDSFLNYKGNLLVCFNEPLSGLWTFDGNKYKLLHNFGASHGQCDAIESYQGKIYAALVGNGGLNGSVQVSADDGLTWADSYLSSQDFDIYSLGVFKGKLYAGAGYLFSRIYEFDGTTWSQVYNGYPGGTAGLVQFIYTYKGLVFAGISNGSGGGIISSSDGHAWNTELDGYSVTRFAEFRGHLYATTQVGFGYPNVLIRNDTTHTWTTLPDIIATQCWGILPYNNVLYVGCTDNVNGGLVYKSYDGFHFTLDFTNNYAGARGTEPFAMYNYNGSLYIGMGFDGPNMADIWRKTDSIGQQTDWINNFANTFRRNTYNGYNWPNDQSLISVTSPFSFDSNVGINTGNPGQMLDVQGTIRSIGLIDTALTASTPVITTASNLLSSGSYSGNTTKIATVSGSLTNTHCVQIDASGNFVDAGGACTTGGGGGTVSAATIGQEAVYTGTTTVGSGVITDNGNIGISSVNPIQKLDVQGTVRALAFTQSGTSINNFTGNVGVGSTTPGQILDVQGTTRSIAYMVGTGSGKITADSNGNIGIGSATPGQQLDVNGTLRASQLIGNTAMFGAYAGVNGGNPNGIAMSGNLGVGTYNPMLELVVIGSRNGPVTSQVRNNTSGTLAEAKYSIVNSSGGVNSFGKLSAGYTPYKNLNASDGYMYTSSGNFSILNDNASGNINLSAGGASSAQLVLGTTGKLDVQTASSGNIISLLPNSSNGGPVEIYSNYWTTEGPLILGTLSNKNNQIYLGTSGNVGIGTTLIPVNKLDVNGSMALGSYAGNNTAPSNGLIVSGNVSIGTLSTVGTSQFTVKSTSSNDQTAAFTSNVAGSSGGAGMVGYLDANTAVVNGDRLGYLFFGGATDSSHTVSRPSGIASFADENWSGSALGSDLRFFTTSNTTTSRNERVRIDNSGNIGIGSTNPGQQLDINGTLRMKGFIDTTNPTSGYVMTTNSVGVGTWAPAASGGGSGTVTSVGVSSSNSTLTIGSSPITTSGTITADINLTNPNTWTGQQIFNTANVGIGSASPGKQLDVQGTIRAVTFTKFGGTSSQFLKADGSTDSTAYGTGSGIVNSGTSGQAAYYASSTAAVSTNSNLIFNGSNVGIGSATPGQVLDVQGTVRSSLGFIAGTGAAAITGDSSGNVGIGSVTPGQTLDVQGTVRAIDFVDTDISSASTGTIICKKANGAFGQCATLVGVVCSSCT